MPLCAGAVLKFLQTVQSLQAPSQIKPHPIHLLALAKEVANIFLQSIFHAGFCRNTVQKLLELNVHALFGGLVLQTGCTRQRRAHITVDTGMLLESTPHIR